MKREGFWRYATPPVNIQGVPLPFTMIYLFICPFPSKTTFWICTGIILFFVILDRSGWTVRTICTRIFSILRGAIASGRPWWYRHHTEPGLRAVMAAVVQQPKAGGQAGKNSASGSLPQPRPMSR